MKIKDDIVADWLPRYTGTPLAEFGQYILLVNFSHYVRLFAQWHSVTTDSSERHLRIGIDSVHQLIHRGLTVKHVRF